MILYRMTLIYQGLSWLLVPRRGFIYILSGSHGVNLMLGYCERLFTCYDSAELNTLLQQSRFSPPN